MTARQPAACGLGDFALIVSACLLGAPVRYDGRRLKAAVPLLENGSADGRVIAVCPELLGGLAVPRPAAQIAGGDGADVLAGRAKVVTAHGEDLSPFFVRGARAALQAAQAAGGRLALLKARSPSCGNRKIYDGSFAGRLQPGQGVTAALFARHGITVFNESEVDELLAWLDRRRRACGHKRFDRGG